MSIGSFTEITCPPSWAYGSKGNKHLKIEPFETLFVEIELFAIKKKEEDRENHEKYKTKFSSFSE